MMLGCAFAEPPSQQHPHRETAGAQKLHSCKQRAYAPSQKAMPFYHSMPVHHLVPNKIRSSIWQLPHSWNSFEIFEHKFDCIMWFHFLRNRSSTQEIMQLLINTSQPAWCTADENLIHLQGTVEQTKSGTLCRKHKYYVIKHPERSTMFAPTCSTTTLYIFDKLKPTHKKHRHNYVAGTIQVPKPKNFKKKNVVCMLQYNVLSQVLVLFASVIWQEHNIVHLLPCQDRPMWRFR